MIKRNLLGPVLAVLFLAGNSYAQDATDQSNPSHHAPSQEAIDACSGKAVGDTCDYTNSKGEDKTGACANTSDGQTLFCKSARKTAS